MLENVKQTFFLVASMTVIITSQNVGDYWRSAIAPNLPTLPITAVAKKDDFKNAYQIIKRVEGGYSNHPNDTGGATYKGITAAVARRWGVANPRDLTDAQVEQIYLEDYWKKSGAHKHPWPLNLAIFNSYVNSGKKWKIPKEGTAQEKAIAYLQQQTDYYHRIVDRNSSQRVFLKGWLNRSKIIEQEILK